MTIALPTDAERLNAIDPATGEAIGSAPITAEDAIPEISGPRAIGAAIVVRAAFSAGPQAQITAVSRCGRTIEVSSTTSLWRHV